MTTRTASAGRRRYDVSQATEGRSWHHDSLALALFGCWILALRKPIKQFIINDLHATANALQDNVGMAVIVGDRTVAVSVFTP